MIDLHEGLRLAALGREQEMAGNVEDPHAADWASWAAFHGTFLIQELLSLREDVARLRNELARYTHQTCHYDAEGNVVCSEDRFP